MMKRVFFLAFGAWMMLAGTALAGSGHCAASAAEAAQVDVSQMSDHCREMMGLSADNAPEMPVDGDPAPEGTATCCCPAVMTALAVSLTPPVTKDVHARWQPPQAVQAHSTLFLLEAPPPRA